MSHHEVASSPEISFVPKHTQGTKRIWKVFWVLLFITIIEVGLGLTLYKTDFAPGAVYFLKGVIAILGLSKAFYILSYFMHLGDEIRTFIFTFILPIVFLIWGMVAFTIDGGASLGNKTRMDSYYLQKFQLLKKQPKTKELSEQLRKENHHE